MQTVTSRQNRRDSIIQLITSHKTRVQLWCAQVFPEDPACAREVAEHTLVRLLSRVEEGEVANLTTWAYLTTWNLCLQRMAHAHTADGEERSKPAAELEPTDLPWMQGLKIINALDEKQRISIKLKDLRGLSYESIARITGQTVAQVHGHVLEARRNFLIKWDKLHRLGERGTRNASPEMLADETEKELRIIFPHMRAEIKDCPNEIRLMQYLESSLPHGESDRVNRHTRVCGICDLLLNRVAEFEREENLSQRPVDTPATPERLNLPIAAGAPAALPRPVEATGRPASAAKAGNPTASQPPARAQGQAAAAMRPEATAKPTPIGDRVQPSLAREATAPVRSDEPEKNRRQPLRIFDPPTPSSQSSESTPPDSEAMPVKTPALRPSAWGIVGAMIIILLAIMGLYIIYGGGFPK